MVRIFPKSANQPNEMALTICNSIFCNCFRLMRDWKLEILANGKEISAVPFPERKKRSTSEGTPQFPNRISGKVPYHLVQSLNSPFFPPHIGAEPGRAKEESRITCMRMLRMNQSKITRSQPRRSRQCVAQCLFQLAL